MKGKFPNGLAAVIKRTGVTQAALAKAAGTTQQTIGKLADGERKLTVDWANRLAPPLRVPPELLVFPALQQTRAPLLSWVSAGRLQEQEGVRRTDIKRYVAADLPKGDWIVLQVEGDSMDKIAPDGALIFVNLKDKHLVHDGFFVFSTPEGTTFKRYRGGPRDRPRLQPFSNNTDHETIYPTGELIVVGRVGRVLIDLLA